MALVEKMNAFFPATGGSSIGKVEQLFIMPSAVDPGAKAYEIIVPEFSRVGLLWCFHLCVEHFREDFGDFLGIHVMIRKDDQKSFLW